MGKKEVLKYRLTIRPTWFLSRTSNKAKVTKLDGADHSANATAGDELVEVHQGFNNSSEGALLVFQLKAL